MHEFGLRLHLPLQGFGGLGQSALSVVSVTMVGQWFRGRLNLAMGIFSVALSVGFMTAFPIIGAIVGSIDFSDFYIVLSGEVAPGTPLAAAREAGAVVLGLGALASVVINFLILAFIIFLMVRYVSKVTAQFAKPEEPAAPAGPTEIELLAEIRDALRK